MTRPRILMADDHQMLLDAFKVMLEPEFDVVGTVTDGRALLEEFARLHPDVVVVDVAMPLLNGLDAGRQLKAQRRSVKLIYPDHEPGSRSGRRSASLWRVRLRAEELGRPRAETGDSGSVARTILHHAAHHEGRRRLADRSAPRGCQRADRRGSAKSCSCWRKASR